MVRWTVPQSDVTDYHLYTGNAPRTYGVPLDVGSMTAATVNGVVYCFYPNLQLGAPYYLAVTATGSAGLESDYSNEKLYDLSTATPPPVDAGPDQTGTVGTVFTLGSAPVAGIDYLWQQTAGPLVSLTSPTSSSTQFTAAAGGTFQFVLTAYDSQGVASQSTVTVVVTSGASPTSTATNPPAPSPMATETATVASLTATPQPTFTVQPTATTTLTPPSTPTVTATPTVPTATASQTPTDTRTPAPTKTKKTRTATVTPMAADVTASPTPTPTDTPAEYDTPTPTATPRNGHRK